MQIGRQREAEREGERSGAFALKARLFVCVCVCVCVCARAAAAACFCVCVFCVTSRRARDLSVFMLKRFVKKKKSRENNIGLGRRLCEGYHN